MALTERQEYKVEVIPPYSVLQVCRADIIERDGKEIARSYHRHVLNPGSDYSNEPAVVQSIALSLWSPALVTAFENQTEPPEQVVDATNYIPDWWTIEQKAEALTELLAELNN